MLILARLPAMVRSFLSSAHMVEPSGVLATTVAEWLKTGIGFGNLLPLTASTRILSHHRLERDGSTDTP